ncbi:MAG: maleylpyruvate isomerase N-terminal domain-containing protein [Acidimicrobiia bacterium]
MSDLDIFAAAYRELRGRVSELAREADPEALETMAPAAPEWRVRDLLAHLSGVCADITAGNLEGVTTDEWTAAQVDARRSWTVDRLLAEWSEQGAAVDALIPSFPPPLATQLLTDGATHEHDVRGGLDAPGARDAAAVALAFPGLVEYGLGAGLHVECDEGTYISGGENDADATVRAPRFELFRAMTGRRSIEQIRTFDWTPEPRPEALVISLFTARDTPLVE